MHGQLLYFLANFVLLALRPGQAREPGCSRFHYEERLLEKLVRMEIVMENFKNRLGKHERDSSEGNIKDGGHTYVRWGKRTCPDPKTDLVYAGFAAGAHYTHTGSGVNYLCLPEHPQFGSKGHDASSVAIIYGAEYETGSSNFMNYLNEHDVPCAVCHVSSPILMIPARTECFSGWKTEYAGYLMSTHYTHVGSKEFVCVDNDPEKAAGSSESNHDGALFYFVKVSACGALKCPPYNTDKIIPCVVCSLIRNP